MTPSPLRWHGGKSYLAPWIINHFPSREDYTHYLEPFAGGLSVLFQHDPTNKAEAINDIHTELTNFWTVLRDHSESLITALLLTPLSQNEWSESFTPEDTPLDRAVAFFVRYRQSRQGLGASYCTPTIRLRRGMNEQVAAWINAVDGLPDAYDRLRRVEIRNMDALAFIRSYDHPKALFYLDPPYLHETRTTPNAYDHELTTEDHRNLLQCLANIQGRFILSGYPSPLYTEQRQRADWNVYYKTIDNKSSNSSAKPNRTECLWTNFPPPSGRVPTNTGLPNP